MYVLERPLPGDDNGVLSLPISTELSSLVIQQT